MQKPMDPMDAMDATDKSEYYIYLVNKGIPVDDVETAISKQTEFRSLEIQDETGSIKAYWFNEAEQPLDLQIGDMITMKNFNVRMFRDSKVLNLVSDKSSVIEKSS